MTILELNDLLYITLNLQRILKQLNSNCIPAFFHDAPDKTMPPVLEVFQGEAESLMQEYRRRIDYIDSIPDAWMRDIFVQRFVERKPFREISVPLGIPSGTLKQEVYAYVKTHPEGYVSTRDLANAWGLNINTVNAWCRLGLLPGAKKRRGLTSGGNQRWIIPAGVRRPERRRK